MDRMLTNIFVSDITPAKEFFMALLGFEVAFEGSLGSNTGFVMLANGQYELGLITNTADLVPEQFRGKPGGFYVTFVVPNVDEIHAKAQTLSVEVIQPPKDEPYGQRRLLLSGPDSVLIDVSTPIAMNTES